jgi:hypothetical protein
VSRLVQRILDYAGTLPKGGILSPRGFLRLGSRGLPPEGPVDAALQARAGASEAAARRPQGGQRRPSVG